MAKQRRQRSCRPPHRYRPACACACTAFPRVLVQSLCGGRGVVLRERRVLLVAGGLPGCAPRPGTSEAAPALDGSIICADKSEELPSEVGRAAAVRGPKRCRAAAAQTCRARRVVRQSSAAAGADPARRGQTRRDLSHVPTIAFRRPPAGKLRCRRAPALDRETSRDRTRACACVTCLPAPRSVAAPNLSFRGRLRCLLDTKLRG
jgi:hypothetical protein